MDRPVLGRGLDELLGRASSPSSSSEKPSSPNTVFQISLERIKPDPLQPRSHFDKKALEELASSLREQGLLQPILVSQEKDGFYKIIAGERRWRAAALAGWQKIPALIKKNEEEQFQKMTTALVENLQRENLNPMEEARAFEWLMTVKNWPQSKIAEIIGKDRSSVANTLRLLQLNPYVQELLSKNKISFSIAKLLLQEKSEEKQKIWARMASQQKLTVRELEEKLKSKPSLKKTSKKTDDLPLWLKLSCNKISKKWNLDVSLKKGFSKNSIVISFSDPEQLKEFMDHV